MLVNKSSKNYMNILK